MKIGNYYIAYLIFGALGFSLAALLVMFNLVPFTVPPIWISILVALSIASNLWYFNVYAQLKSHFNIEKVLAPIVVVGVFALATALFPDLLKIGNLPAIYLVKTAEVFDFLITYVALVYFLICLFLFQKLIFERKDNFVVRQWQLFMIVLSATIVADIRDVHLPNFLDWILLVTGILIILPLLIRIKWIAQLKKEERPLCLLYLVIIVAINSALIQKLYFIDLPYILNDPLRDNLFGTLLITFVGGYSLLALLGLLFHLPVASVLEEQQAEIMGFQEMGRVWQSHSSDEDILKQLFNECYNITNSDAGWLVLNSKLRKGRINFTNKITSEEIGYINIRINFKELIKGKPELGYFYFENLQEGEFFASRSIAYASLLILPIYDSTDEWQAAICLTKSYKNGFDEYSINIAESYIGQAKLAMQNHHLIQDSLANARYRQELEIATKVQRALIPDEFPPSRFYEITGFHQSATEVGGDYYDYNQINDKQLAVVIGDVSGKGTSAAFHMAQMKGVFQSLIQLVLPGDHFLTMANQALSQCLEKGRFITLTYIHLDFKQKKAVISRAGHCPTLYYNSVTKETTYLSGEGLGLGIIRNKTYARFASSNTMELNVGDILLLYTDGLVEARRPNSNEQYGYENLKQVFQANTDKNVEEIKMTVLENFKEFIEYSGYQDDTCLVIIKILELGGKKQAVIEAV